MRDLFVDDCALNASTETKMQQCVDCFSTVGYSFGFTIRTKKTGDFVSQPCTPTITVKEETLKAVDKFTYFGSTLSRSVNFNAEHLCADCDRTFRVRIGPGGTS